MKNLSFFNKIIYILNWLCGASLLLSYLASYVNPINFTLPAFFGLAYPYILAINILFVIYWIFLWKKVVWISLSIILIGWNSIFKLIQFNNNDDNNGLKVMSYNVRVFDLYNWSNNGETKNKMFDMMRKEKPDIMCLQEFFHFADKRYFNTLDTLLELQSARQVHVEYTTTPNISHFGIATFSKHKIVDGGRIEFHEKGPTPNNICIYTDIQIGNDTIRVYNMHLASIHFKKNDYKMVEQLGDIETEKQIAGAKSMFTRLHLAFKKRAKQAELIAKQIALSPYPVILCGDFNDTPFSYSYNTISSNLIDAFQESGNGIGATYNGSFPAFRIDYIMHSRDLISTNYQTIPEKLSDHYPITCRIRLTE